MTPGQITNGLMTVQLRWHRPSKSKRWKAGRVETTRSWILMASDEQRNALMSQLRLSMGLRVASPASAIGPVSRACEAPMINLGVGAGLSCCSRLSHLVIDSSRQLHICHQRSGRIMVVICVRASKRRPRVRGSDCSHAPMSQVPGDSYDTEKCLDDCEKYYK